MRLGIIPALLMLTGCLGQTDLPKLADVDLATDAPSAALVAPEAGIGEDQQAEPSKKRGGFFGLFGRGDKAAKTADRPAEETAPVEAAVAPQSEPAEPTKPRRKGLFGLFGGGSDAVETVAPDQPLEFGQIASVCGLRRAKLGKEVDRFKSYRLYESRGSENGLRTYSLTGMKDGCARQFKAAMAMLGSPTMHEQMRYDSSNDSLSISDTDKAYERIKSRICPGTRSKPCRDKRIPKLEKTAAYVTAYPSFGSNSRWFEILLHKGKIAASSTRAR